MNHRFVSTPFLFITISVLIGAYFVHLAQDRRLTTLEGVLLQMFSLLSGIIGSYLIGKGQAIDQNFKRYVQSAVRRLTSLRQSLAGILTTIDSSIDSESKVRVVRATIEDQLLTVNDARDDWLSIILIPAEKDPIDPP